MMKASEIREKAIVWYYDGSPPNEDFIDMRHVELLYALTQLLEKKK